MSAAVQDHLEAQTQPAPRAAERRESFVHPGLGLPFALVVCCFAAWGMATDMTAPLVKIFKSVFSMTNLQSSLVQTAYYGAYFCLAIPAAFINNRLGYKRGVLIGLSLAGFGGLLFFPASKIMTYGVFLGALFTLAAGLSILETSANPFVMSMGPEHNATRRLNFAQAFNPIGSNLGVLIAATLMLPYVNATDAERAAMSQAELLATRKGELSAVMGPYIGLATLYLVLAFLISRVKVPEGVHREHMASDSTDSGGRFMRLLSNKRYSFGVVAQYFNVGAQTCIWTYIIHYVTETLGVSNKVGGYWLQASLLTFLVFRFVMVALMGRFDARKLLLFMCATGVVLTLFAMVSANVAGAVAVAALSACISLLFPTIYGEALQGLGEDTKFGAAGLVMAIIGGATVPLLQGWLIDKTSVPFSFITVVICFTVVAAYGLYTIRTPRPGEAA